MSIYVFLKDAPCGAKKGDKLHLHNDGKYHIHDKVNLNGWIPYDPRIVENNPEWFEPFVKQKVFYKVDTSKWEIITSEFNHYTNHFGTKLEAEEYISLNKPCLCINDVLQALRDIFEETGEFKPSPGTIMSKLKELPKINFNDGRIQHRR